ncbi:ATP-NAD kinase-like domain-containing protein [Xylaria bambusicola]|uniref:ATP-NAD kinase-like domain-containing protein n=1 Tax=Xylaria bambusicola TaxID=326684 RepID=UPI0020084213|nr:ATP-NAD kinase-like domain-containing protein [Xylaria bambusicola]KAI0505174.1 ATP-NAD kinase-like domain-containing protein [Xylaria bambusicola]
MLPSSVLTRLGLGPVPRRLCVRRATTAPPSPLSASASLLRPFSATALRREILDVSILPPRIKPKYKDSPTSSLLSLQWPEPPRNILIIPKFHAPQVTLSAVTFAKHVHQEYSGVNLVFEHRVASQIHETLPFPIYTADPSAMHDKIDLVATLGGDGTILRAASLFSLHSSVPPMLSFSMGSLGFLGEWKFDEYKRAWRQVYMSGSRVAVTDLQDPHTQAAANRQHNDQDDLPLHDAWSHVRGKSMGLTRSSKVLLRHRLKVGVYDADGVNINSQLMPTSTAEPQQLLPPMPVATKTPDERAEPMKRAFHAINELVIHRGPNPHLAIIDVYVNGRFLTEAVADGILVSTPTGSTAYSLSAGGSIMHPLVKALLITPICARSLSFRPLGLPLNSKVVLKLSEKNRGRELEVSIDGKRKSGVTIGMEIRVEGETVGRTTDGGWAGGVPCVIRSPANGNPTEDDDGWVGGLNGLLKFNYPFGEA